MALPVEQYAKFREEYVYSIRSLYDTRPILFKGMVGFAGVFFFIWFATMDRAYLAGMAANIVIWMVRSWDFTRFDRESSATPLTFERAKHWEMRYIIGSSAACLNLSLMCFYAFVHEANVVAMVGTIGVSMAALLAVVGRNFGSRLNIDVMCASTCIPIAVGMLLSGDTFLAIIGLTFFPMISSTRQMANVVRKTVHKAWFSMNEVQEIADQFSAALDNMAHGLFMVDTKGRISVANAKAGELLYSTDPKAFEGSSFFSLIRLARRKGTISKDRAATVTEQCCRLFSGDSDRELVEISTGSFLDVSAEVREGKGVVLSFEDATQRIVSEREVTRLARFDALSELPNRMWLSELVTTSVRNMDPKLQVLFTVFDVDRFKQINDTMGHSAGDKVIQHVGRRLNQIIANDQRVIAGRLGGDEFVLAVVGLRPDEDESELLDLMYRQIDGIHVLMGKRVEIRVSGGVILSDRANFDMDEVLIKADLALYKSKKSESVTWTIFAKDMDDNYRRRQRLTKDLREALASNGLTAAYQPMLTPDGRKVVAFEALARWNHEELGTIPPQEFIAIAEEVGLVGEITKHVLRTACRDCANWSDDISVSVNLSAIDVSDPEIVEAIRNTLDETCLPPHRLQVEITETSLATDVQKTRNILQAIRSMGVKTALDDFGTGYSSLSYMGEFPVDKVKIDRSFVTNVLSNTNAADLLEAVIHLANKLKLEVVVEGIEDHAHLAKVRSMGNVALVQGWVFGRAMPLEDLPAFLVKVADGRRAAPEQVNNVVRLKQATA